MTPQPSTTGLLELLREIRPMADYGRVGTRDIDQGRFQRALDAAIAALASQAQPVPEAIESLVSALAESRGWMRDYSRSIIEDAIEREPLNSFHQAQPSGKAATAGEEDRRMAFCPACFVEVTPEQAGQQTLDARRYRWLRDEENGDSDLCPFVAGATLDAAIDAAMKSTAPGSADNAVRPTDEKESVAALPVQQWIPVIESYWQRGCNDGKAGRDSKPPTNEGRWTPANAGYYNGYRFGRLVRAVDQGEQQ